MNNIIINGITAVCLIALVVQAVVWFVMLFCRGRTKDIEFLESFKKGQFAIVYVTAIPLYVIGFMHSGKDFFKAFFNSVSKIIELVVLKYDFECIEPLMDANSFYKVTVFICFVMAGLNIVFVALSVLSRRIWEFSRRNKIRYCPKDRIFIFGNNPRSLDIYASDTERNKIIVDDIPDEDRERYFKENIWYFADSDEEIIEEIFKKRPFAAFRRKIYERLKKDSTTSRNIVIVNTEDDERNAHICRCMIEKIDACDAAGKEELFKTLRIFVFGDLAYEAIYEDIVDDGSGCITYLNKYKKIGADFIEHHPLALYMSKKHIDYQTSLVKKDVDINVFMICFGKVGRQIFLTSVANNQFLTAGENGPELKKVKYHIFDKEVARNNKNLNHSYYRYRDEMEACRKEGCKDYLPLPSLPAEEYFHHFDINDSKLYEMLKNSVKKGDANFVIISFGNDLENIDLAQKLVAKRREWGQDFVIFVRAHKETKEQKTLENDGCIFIGDETKVVYNIKKILSDRMMNVAIMRNEDYDLEYAVNTEKEKNEKFVPTPEFVEAVKYASFKKWHTMNRVERESNLYAALSIRAKLNLIGLDYCDVSDRRKAVSRDYYMSLYAKNDMPEWIEGKDGETVSGRQLVKYTLDFPESRRKNMAILEHFRWNSYYISRGYIPASIEQIRNEKLPGKDGVFKYSNGKNHDARRHGNLTTYDGLVDFRKIVAERDKKEEKDKDVIKYDYQLLDDIYYFLTESGYKIVKKEHRK